MRGNEELHARMHPWLAGAQYRSTAVVLRVSFDLVNRTALSCIYILLYVPFLSMHSVVHVVEKKKDATRQEDEKERERMERNKLRACVCTYGRRCLAIGALFAKYLPGYHEHNTVPQKFVRRLVSFINRALQIQYTIYPPSIYSAYYHLTLIIISHYFINFAILYYSLLIFYI